MTTDLDLWEQEFIEMKRRTRWHFAHMALRVLFYISVALAALAIDYVAGVLLTRAV